MSEKWSIYSKLASEELDEAFNHLFKSLHFLEAGIACGMGVDSSVVGSYEDIMDIVQDFYEIINGPVNEELDEDLEDIDDEEDE